MCSMLVSPLMSPIIAMTLATNIRSRKLAFLGAYNFGISMVLCIIVGFLVSKFLLGCKMTNKLCLTKILSNDVIWVMEKPVNSYIDIEM
jgi:uncharacterized membrane protein